MKKIIKSEYGKFLNEIKSRIVSARIQAVRSVNQELIRLYWDIGRSIVERQEKFGWGKGVVEQLSRDLTHEYANFEGYSRDNLWRMRMFYLEYKDNSKLAQLVPELPWGHNILIMQKVKNEKEREYYITLKKIPQAVLGKCEFGKDNYDLNIINAPKENEVENNEA